MNKNSKFSNFKNPPFSTFNSQVFYNQRLGNFNFGSAPSFAPIVALFALKTFDHRKVKKRLNEIN